MVNQRHAAYAEEAAEVEVLNASLSKMKSTTKKMDGSMSRIDETGKTVQDTIAPIYDKTTELQTIKRNVDNMLAAIERFRAPMEMKNQEERIIRSRVDKVGLTEYIASIDRTSQALQQLRATNMKSNQSTISELSSLLAVGTGNLENVFKDMLRVDSQPIEPLKQITHQQEFPRLSSDNTSQLRAIHANMSNYTSQFASSTDLAPSAKAYAHERGKYLHHSLENLATASTTTSKKTSADAVYKPGKCAISTYATALQEMYIAEYDNICPIFSREEWGPVLSATCQESLRLFAKTLKDLDAHVRNHIVTDCYLAYEIIEVVSNASFKIEAHTTELKQAMSDALKPIRETAKSSLSTLLNETRTKINQMLQIPGDASAVQITTDVMVRLQLMPQYLAPLSSIMRSLGDGGWNRPSDSASSASVPTLKSFDVGADGKQLFSHYATDTIDLLLSSLDSKAKLLLPARRGAQGVFLANNIAAMERMIRDSELAGLLGTARPKVDAWKKKATNSFLDPWKEVSGHLLDVQYTSKQPRPPSTGQGVDSAAILKSLSSKDKEAIKKKFDDFNAAFSNTVNTHKSYKMDAETRRMLGAEVQKTIEPLYVRFWERYHEVDKGKGKHVKYDKSQMSAVLASLG